MRGRKAGSSCSVVRHWRKLTRRRYGQRVWTWRRCVALLAVVAGCYNPRFREDLACGPDGECPEGQACGPDSRCHPPGSFPIDAPQGMLDAFQTTPDTSLPPIDAVPVGCQSNADCQNPPDACASPGTCNLTTGVCAFGAVDCSHLNDSCNAGTCDVAAGGCVKRPVPNGMTCGQDACGPFGDCVIDTGDVCDSTGAVSRSCTRFTCQAGMCTSNGYVDTQPCSIPTDGRPCGQSSVTNCGACSGSSEAGCAFDGQQTCTCTDRACMNDTCQATSSSCIQTGCAVLSEGTLCNIFSNQCFPGDLFICCVAGTCGAPCGCG
jgi:hypothetical protein